MIRNALRNKAVMLPAVTGLVSAAVAFPAFATESDSSGVVTAADWSSVLTSLTNQISVSTVVGVLATTVTAGVGLVFMWWGLRKLVRTVMAAFRKGRMSV